MCLLREMRLLCYLWGLRMQKGEKVIDYSRFRFGNWDVENRGRRLDYLGEVRANLIDGTWVLTQQSQGNAESTLVAIRELKRFEARFDIPKLDPPKGHEWRRHPGGVRLVKVDGELEEHAGQITTLEQAYVARAISDGYIEMCGTRGDKVGP